ncbi:chorismate synthase [mine drainage metagenome]|uniref:chorismate synthase n=1 Tax=mine drainage metagenome TaxID=410659 RepID=T1CW37_9ZZZZ
MGFGERLRMTVFGSSHGPEVGVVVDGVPAGVIVDLPAVQRQLDRRRPVGRRLATRRREEDLLEVDSGLVDGITDGGPLRAHVANTDVRRAPYERLGDVPRPGHADFPARVRYGPAADLSGGGIFSGRMTVGLVIAGAIARGLLAGAGVDVVGFTRSIGSVDAAVPETASLAELRALAARHEVETPDPVAAIRMDEAIQAARRDGDSLGGVVEVRADGLPVGMGEPFFDSVESEIAHAFFSVPAVKGVEFGAGFAGARMHGSEHNDPFLWVDGRVRTRTNHAGGILGGLTTGMPLVVRAAVKPTSSIARPQRSVDLASHRETTVIVTGRHDPCIVPRAVGVLENVTAFVLADLALRGGFLP